MKKRLFTSILIISTIFILTACTKDKEEKKEAKESITYGTLSQIADEQQEKAQYYIQYDLNDEFKDYKKVEYVKIDSLISDLNADKIAFAWLPKTTADFYMTANDKLDILDKTNQTTSFAMAVDFENEDLYSKLNNAILLLQENGKINQITDTYIKNLDNGKIPEDAKIEALEGAPTIKVAVSGNLAPLDYINKEGKPSGFSIALLSEISKLTGYNIETVIVDPNERDKAIYDKKVDAIMCYETHTEDMESSCNDFLKTKSYFVDSVRIIYNKDSKNLNSLNDTYKTDIVDKLDN